MTKQKAKFLALAVKAALDGGEKIMEVYSKEDFAVEIKEDKSPLTQADTDCNNAITETLDEIKLPILSEEGKAMHFQERSQWELFWIVDPLDGTKEFVKRNGEFTVNIALVHKVSPILGVIYVPVKDVLYFASSELGAYRLDEAKNKVSFAFSEHVESYESIVASIVADSAELPLESERSVFTIVGSRSHMNDETKEFIDKHRETHGTIDMVAVGSSLKICQVAEGSADIYPRFAPTMEWDTCAGHAIAKFSGARVVRADNGKELLYNKENLLNPWFLVDRQN